MPQQCCFNSLDYRKEEQCFHILFTLNLFQNFCVAPSIHFSVSITWFVRVSLHFTVSVLLVTCTMMFHFVVCLNFVYAISGCTEISHFGDFCFLLIQLENVFPLQHFAVPLCIRHNQFLQDWLTFRFLRYLQVFLYLVYDKNLILFCSTYT